MGEIGIILWITWFAIGIFGTYLLWRYVLTCDLTLGKLICSILMPLFGYVMFLYAIACIMDENKTFDIVVMKRKNKEE